MVSTEAAEEIAEFFYIEGKDPIIIEKEGPSKGVTLPFIEAYDPYQHQHMLEVVSMIPMWRC